MSLLGLPPCWGWEWSALPGGANLHRVVVTDASADQARTFQPASIAPGRTGSANLDRQLYC